MLSLGFYACISKVSYFIIYVRLYSTQRVYKQAYSTYKAFVENLYDHSHYLPISVSRLAKFIAYLTQLGYVSSSIQTNVSGICYINTIAGYPNPSNDNFIKKNIKGF